MSRKTLFHKRLASIIFSSLIIPVSSGLWASPDKTSDTLYKQALDLARKGQFDQALPVLAGLSKQYPLVPRYQYDYLQVLLWAGKNKEVLQLSRDIKTAEAPDYALATIARAARNTKQFTRAESLYRNLVNRNPNQVIYKTGLASVLIDQHKTPQARKILNQLLSSQPDNIDVLMVLAYAEESDADYLAASKIYDKVLHLKLNYKPAIKGLVFAQSAAKSFDVAYQNAVLYRHVFSDQEWIKLHWDLAAKLIRWGEIPNKQNKWRYAETHYAITRIKKNLKMLEQMQPENADIWEDRAHFDLLVAYRDCKKMSDAIDLYQQLKLNQIKLPAYVKIAAADAFLYAEQPNKARDLYLEVLKEISNSYNAQQSLVYAYLENEQLDLANQLARQMAKKQPEKLWFKKPGHKNLLYSLGNPKKTETELAVAVMEAFSDRLDIALKKINFLYKNASFNADIRNARANIYYYRGWPRQAHRQLVSALNIEPKHIGLRTSLSRVLHELREYPQEEKNTEALYEKYYDDKGVQKQKRLWTIHNQRELKIFTQGEISDTESNSPSPVNGSEMVSLDSYLYSQPLNYNYRLFTHFNWQTGVFNSGDGVNLTRGYFRRYGLGLEYAIPDLILTGEIHYDNSALETVGFKGTIDYQFNDFWSAGFTFDSRSNAIGLRALSTGASDEQNIQGVTAYGYTAYTTYRMHESRQFTLSHQYYDYSDGNQNYAANFKYFERWISGPIYKFSTYLNVGTSLNTEQGGNYYHPENDFTTSVTFHNNILTYRHYDTTFHQNIALSVGYYWQKEFEQNNKPTYNTDPIGSIQYEHVWKTLNRYELVYGAVRSYAVYDGEPTETWRFYLNLNVRF